MQENQKTCFLLGNQTKIFPYCRFVGKNKPVQIPFRSSTI